MTDEVPFFLAPEAGGSLALRPLPDGTVLVEVTDVTHGDDGEAAIHLTHDEFRAVVHAARRLLAEPGV